MTKQIQEVNIKDIRILESGRFRINNLQDLMESIKQVGLIQPITLRRSDMAVVCGNRRLSACKKLGWKTIPAILTDVTNKELFLSNLSENMKRKNVSTIEIGRMCHGLSKGILIDEKMSISEIATRLGMTGSRVKTCIFAFEKMPKEFHKDIKFFATSQTREVGDIPESCVKAIAWCCQRTRLIDEDAKLLIEAVRDKKLEPLDVQCIQMMMEGGSSLKDAINEIDNWVISSFKIVFNKKEFINEVRRAKTTKTNFIKNLLRKQNKNLIF